MTPLEKIINNPKSYVDYMYYLGREIRRYCPPDVRYEVFFNYRSEAPCQDCVEIISNFINWNPMNELHKHSVCFDFMPEGVVFAYTVGA